MASSRELSISDLQALVAELRAQTSSMQAGFTTYSQTVMRQSLMLTGVQKELEELKQDKKAKDARIDVLERRINELEEINAQKQPQEQDDEVPSIQSAIGVALEEQNILLRQFAEEKEDEITELERKMARLKAGETDERQRAVDSATEDKTKARAAREKDLIDASYGGMVEEVKALIANGAHVDAADFTGQTTLMIAAWRDHLSVVEVLITKGADPDATSSDGSTGLMLAAYGGQADVVKALIKGGASLNIRSNNGDTALDRAHILGPWTENPNYPRTIEILTAAGAKRGRDL